MKIDPRQRWIVLVALLMAALTAVAWVREADTKRDAEVVEAPARPRPPPGARGADPATPDRVHLEKLHGRDPNPNANSDAFAKRSWRKPAPKAVAKVPVAVAALPAESSPSIVPPPLPFTYMGRMLTEEANAVFLTQGERNLIVHEGEIIESTYRVDKVSETRLTFTHLPSGVEQHLAIGAPQ